MTSRATKLNRKHGKKKMQWKTDSGSITHLLTPTQTSRIMWADPSSHLGRPGFNSDRASGFHGNLFASSFGRYQ